MVQALLEDLPGMFEGTSVTHSGLGAALQMAEKLLVSMYTFTESKLHPLLILSIEYLDTCFNKRSIHVQLS